MDFKTNFTTGASLLMLLIKRDTDDYFYDFDDSTLDVAVEKSVRAVEDIK